VAEADEVQGAAMSKGSKWSKSQRNGRYSGPFVGRMATMLESPAHRVLSLAALRVMARIESEHLAHAGTENGRLIVTFRQFEEWGVHRDSVAPAIRELEALGFIEVTERGCAGNADSRKANRYRMTYRPAEGHPADGSHEWRRIKTMEEAEAIQKEARKTPRANTVRRGGKRVPKNKIPVTVSGGGAAHGFRQSPPMDSVSGTHRNPRPWIPWVLSRSGSGPSAADAATPQAGKAAKRAAEKKAEEAASR
jgi:hypothetical protein